MFRHSCFYDAQLLIGNQRVVLFQHLIVHLPFFLDYRLFNNDVYDLLNGYFLDFAHARHALCLLHVVLEPLVVGFGARSFHVEGGAHGCLVLLLGFVVVPERLLFHLQLDLVDVVETLLLPCFLVIQGEVVVAALFGLEFKLVFEVLLGLAVSGLDFGGHLGQVLQVLLLQGHFPGFLEGQGSLRGGDFGHDVVFGVEVL